MNGGYIALGVVAFFAWVFAMYCRDENPDTPVGKLLSRNFGYVRWPIFVVACLLYTSPSPRDS